MKYYVDGVLKNGGGLNSEILNGEGVQDVYLCRGEVKHITNLFGFLSIFFVKVVGGAYLQRQSLQPKTYLLHVKTIYKFQYHTTSTKRGKLFLLMSF